jgi:hypothetical protein
MDDENKGLNERWAPASPIQERGYASEPQYRSGESADTAPDDGLGESAARAREIRSEIDRTRDDIGETIDAIQDRLSPRNVVSRAAGNVREATIGKVREMAHNVQDRMPAFGDDDHYSGGGFVERIRENPVPAAIAAASLAWIAFSGRRRAHSPEFGRAIYGSTRGGEPYVREARINMGESESHGWAESGSVSAGSGSEWRSDARDSMQRSGSQLRAARRRAQQITDERPFAAGAIAAAVGLAIGLVIPETEREDELMGDAKEALVERGRQTVSEAAGRVQNAAAEVQRVAGEALTGGGASGENKAGENTPRARQTGATS